MLKDKTISVVGGDMRNAYLANALAEKYENIKVYGVCLGDEINLSEKIHKTDDYKNALKDSDIIIFALPILDMDGFINAPETKKKMQYKECFKYILPGSIVLAGKVGKELQEFADDKNIKMIDYLEREEFAVLNAVPTAEGAIGIAINEMPSTLFNSKCVVVGYGRIGKVLTGYLKALGAKTVTAARKYSDLAWIKASGCQAVHISELKDYLRDADVLFNTVPAVILDEEKLSALSKNCLVIDLASKPGGVDFETARILGLKVIWALSLPGKCAPVSAAQIVLDTVINILEERGML